MLYYWIEKSLSDPISGLLQRREKYTMKKLLFLVLIIAAAVVALLVLVELIYMTAVKRASNRYLAGLMAPKREE